MAFGPDTTAEDVVAGVDLTGKTAVITGATSGLGLETARVLATAGARVVLTARDDAKGAEAVAAARSAGGGGDVEYVTLDLSSLASVRACAAAVSSRHPAIDILVNNAGVMATPFGRTADGFETQFGTNHLGHFLFTNLLTTELLRGAPARVVNLSSGGHVSSGIRWDDPNYEGGDADYQPWKAYGASKTANILFTVELDRRLRGRGVRAYAVHPGMVATNLGRHMSADQGRDLAKRASAAKLPPIRRIPVGAATQVWAATAPELDEAGGVYLADCAISSEHADWALDEADAARLWALSEKLVGQTFDR